MSALLDSLLDPERRQQCAANEPKQRLYRIVIDGNEAEALTLPYANAMDAWDAANSIAGPEGRVEVMLVDAAGKVIPFRERVVHHELAQAELRQERERIEADVARNQNKGWTLAARHDAVALDAQVMNLDAMRRAGWL